MVISIDLYVYFENASFCFCEENPKMQLIIKTLKIVFIYDFGNSMINMWRHLTFLYDWGLIFILVIFS